MTESAPQTSGPRSAANAFNPRDLPWIAIALLVSAIFCIVALDQLISLHFEAWRLYPNRTPESADLAFWHGMVTGWIRPVVVALFVAAGALVGFHLIDGRRLPVATLGGGLLLHFLAVEATQGVGQEASPVSEIERASTVSLVLAVALVVVPLAALGLSLWLLIKPDRGSSHKPLPPLGRAAN